MLLQYVYSYFSFYYPSAFYFSMGKKLWRYIYNSPPHVSVITGNILITRIKFARYHLLLATNSTFLADSMYLGCNSDLSKLEWTSLLFNFNYIRDLTKTRKLFSIPVADYASFSHQARTFKTNLLGLISNFSRIPFLNITSKQAQFVSFSYLHMYLPL